MHTHQPRATSSYRVLVTDNIAPELVNGAPRHYRSPLQTEQDARSLIDAAKQEGIFEKTIFLFGGPRVDHKTALELGFDAGFGPGTKPSDVANYVYYRMMERSGRAPAPQPTAHGTVDAVIQGATASPSGEPVKR